MICKFSEVHMFQLSYTLQNTLLLQFPKLHPHPSPKKEKNKIIQKILRFYASSSLQSLGLTDSFHKYLSLDFRNSYYNTYCKLQGTKINTL